MSSVLDHNTPIAYLKGHQDFYGRDYIVTPDVLIPRPETEQIIDAVLNLAGKSFLPCVKPNKRSLPNNPKIVDVGTGSGCIAITIKKEFPEAEVTAVDISRPALKIAQKNAKKHSASISFIISNLLENVKFTPNLVVANLPYVDKNWDWLNLADLSHEPEIALFADDHGLLLIKRLIKQAAQKGVKYLILEADPSQHTEIQKYAESNNYQLQKTRGFILSLYNPQA